MNLQSEQSTQCPYCGEAISILIDRSLIDVDSSQALEYIEDCEVCCRPIIFQLLALGEGQIQLLPFTENE